MSRRKFTSTLLTPLVAAFLLLGPQANVASARTQHASFGAPSTASDPTIGLAFVAFQAHAAGVLHIIATTSGWTMPLIFDIAGEKHIHVKAKVSSGSSLQCVAQSFSGAGVFLGQSSVATFAATGVFTSQELILPAAAVPLGAQAAVTCAATGNGVALLGLEY